MRNGRCRGNIEAGRCDERLGRYPRPEERPEDEAGSRAARTHRGVARCRGVGAQPPDDGTVAVLCPGRGNQEPVCGAAPRLPAGADAEPGCARGEAGAREDLPDTLETPAIIVVTSALAADP